MSQTRSSFVRGSAATFASIAVVRARAEAAEFEYKFGHDMPIDHPLHVWTVQMWNAVRKETGGRLNVQIFPQNTLGSDSAALTQIRSGALQFTCISGAIISNVVPVTQIENLPFAFKTPADVFRAMDGPLGAYLRSEMEAKDIYAFPLMWDLGFRQVTSSTHPIRDAGDFGNFKIRTPPSKIFVDAFKTLGAIPESISFNEVYTALQTRIVDGQETPYSVIETSKLFEVQKYLSVTNHIWAGWWLLANPEAWKALPADVQAVVTANASKYALLERRNVDILNNSLSEKLQRQGLTINQADSASIKAALGPFYGRWKDQLGTRAWSLLESSVGPVG